MINKELDRLKLKVFTEKNSAFYGPLMCGLDFIWDSDQPTAYVSASRKLGWNPQFFSSLTEPVRIAVLMHEMEHIARLHFNRRGSRDGKKWNIACDYEINQDLINQGFVFGDLPIKYDKQYLGKSAEEIYELIPDSEEDDSFGGGEGDMDSDSGPTQEELADLISTVAYAHQSAITSDSYSKDLSSAVSENLDRFLKSTVPWEVYLRKYLTQRGSFRNNWKRPKRRFEDVYLPSREPNLDALQDIAFYLDCSGSVTKELGEILNSEIKRVKEKFNPEKLTVVKFDTSIREEVNITRNSPYKDLELVGRGGTCLECVREHILKTKPKLVIICSDMWCAPMDPIRGMDILWLVIDNKDTKVNQGKVIHISQDDYK